MTGKVLEAMIFYFDGDIRRINHALKVYGYAKTIAEQEGLEEEELLITECAAVLHDIGIPESERIYNSSAGKYQEEQGRIVGKEILQKLDFPEKMAEPIIDIIGSHHSYDVDLGLPLQIIFEADFFVNIEEGNLSNPDPEKIIERFFRTETGKNMMKSIFLKN